MRTLTIISGIMAFISMMYFLFFSTFNRQIGYASMLLLFVIIAYLNLTANKGKGADSNRH